MTIESNHLPDAFPTRRNMTTRAIMALSQPGGRFAGIELPPTWYPQKPHATIPSALPTPGNMADVNEAVREMSLALRDAAARVHAESAHPMLIGGDHSLTAGTLAAATAAHGRVAVVWIDAHADFNIPETSPTGNPHGMPLAIACGLGDPRFTELFRPAGAPGPTFVAPSDVVLIGARDIDPEERALLTAHGVWHVSVPALRAQGVSTLVEEIRARFRGLPVHLSFDFDAITGDCFTATGTPVDGGLSPEEGVGLLMGLAGTDLRFVSSDWVEFDPLHPDAERCAELARRLFSAFHGEL